MKYSMDSQLTLVEPCSPTLSEENIVLIFDRDDMLSTALRIRGNDLPSYTVNTRRNTTTIYAGNCLLATITRRMFRWNQIVFPGLKPMRLGSWLKAPTLSHFPLVFHAWGRQFEWRENVAGQLVLREPSYPDVIVARFSSSCNRRWWHGDHVTQAASLTIKPEMGEMIDMIVLSCVVAEHRLRVISVGPETTAMYTMMML